MSTKPHHFSRNKCARHNVALRSHKSKCAIIDDDKEVLKLPLQYVCDSVARVFSPAVTHVLQYVCVKSGGKTRAGERSLLDLLRLGLDSDRLGRESMNLFPNRLLDVVCRWRRPAFLAGTMVWNSSRRSETETRDGTYHGQKRLRIKRISIDCFQVCAILDSLTVLVRCARSEHTGGGLSPLSTSR